MWHCASAIGAFGFVLAMLGSWIPSLWGDEVATLMSAERPWPSLFRMLGNLDAVHGTYYSLMHLWIDVFGTSAFSLRFPSAIAVGVAAAGVVVLARRLGGTRVAVIAGVAFCILPRTTYMGTEARSYALGTACAIWLTVLLVRLVVGRVRSRVAWLGYSLLFAISIYVFLYLVLMAVVYAVTLLACTRDRRVLLRWFGWSALGVAIATPVVVYASRERGQIAFLGRHPGVSLDRYFVSQWFGAYPMAVVAWLAIGALAAASVVVWLRARRFRRGIELAGSAPAAGAEPSLLVLAFAWFLIPPILLLVANLFMPLYTVRYMSFVTPAIGILLALAIDALAHTHRWRVGVAVAVLFALAAPEYVAERGPYAMGGSDWASVGHVIAQHSRPGDDIVFDETARPSRKPRMALHAYPQDFTNVTDVTLASPYVDNPGLWDTTIPIASAAGRLAAGDGTVWLIEYRGKTKSGTVSSTGMQRRLGALRALGYTVRRHYSLHRDDVIELTKGQTS